MASYVEIIRLFLSSQTLDFRKNTPAYAGNTSDPSSTIPVFRDRPRAGSPPLARGIHPVARWIRSGAGITPACAGNTEAKKEQKSRHKDHPRLRGEYSPLGDRLAAHPGSPPLARGIHITDEIRFDPSRITPACAGNTIIFAPGKFILKDHPRLRGEYIKQQYTAIPASGSPPLARGIRMRTAQDKSRSGITPACAGNTKT